MVGREPLSAQRQVQLQAPALPEPGMRAGRRAEPAGQAWRVVAADNPAASACSLCSKTKGSRTVLWELTGRPEPPVELPPPCPGGGDVMARAACCSGWGGLQLPEGSRLPAFSVWSLPLVCCQQLLIQRLVSLRSHCSLHRRVFDIALEGPGPGPSSPAPPQPPHLHRPHRPHPAAFGGVSFRTEKLPLWGSRGT